MHNMTTSFFKKIINHLLLLIVILLPQSYVMAQDIDQQVSSTISTLGEYYNGSVAPGEALPVQIQLLNFGTPNDTVDTTLYFSIIDDNGQTVLTRSETLAVQTTASFSRYIVIPDNTLSGKYLIQLDVEYSGQKYPAISQQPFVVEQKWWGYTYREWLSALPLIVAPLLIIAFLYFLRNKKARQYTHDYSHIGESERFYYEIIHNIIVSLHYHVGDKKMKKILASLPGIKMDTTNKQIQYVGDNPEKIVSSLMRYYEQETGAPANIVFDKNNETARILK